MIIHRMRVTIEPETFSFRDQDKSIPITYRMKIVVESGGKKWSYVEAIPIDHFKSVYGYIFDRAKEEIKKGFLDKFKKEKEKKCE